MQDSASLWTIANKVLPAEGVGTVQGAEGTWCKDALVS